MPTRHTPKHTKDIQTVDMVIKLFAVMMISIQNQYNYIVVKRLYTNSCKIC